VPHPLTTPLLTILLKPEGQAALDWVATQRLAGQTSLQIQQRNRQIDASLLRGALYLWDQRDRGTSKFGDRAQTLYFDDDGLQMASSLAVARHRATRFGDEPVVDLCCGIGGDLMALAERGLCIGVDVDAARLLMAQANTASQQGNVQLICGDAAAAPVRAGTAAIADPARRQGGRRARSGKDYEPDLGCIDIWRRHFDHIAVKVSPALDPAEVPSREEVEYVSWQGQCREAVFWFGAHSGCRRRASLILEQVTHTMASANDQILRPQVELAGAYLYDPDPAIVRSHLVGELARELDAWLIAADVAYLSTQQLQPTPWARALKVVEQVPFQLKNLQRLMRRNGWQPGGIRRRHFPIEPETLRRQLGRFGAETERMELVCTRIAGKTTVFICAPVDETAR
jgi:SAM-dependent methyltransferase